MGKYRVKLKAWDQLKKEGVYDSSLGIIKGYGSYNYIDLKILQRLPDDRIIKISPLEGGDLFYTDGYYNNYYLERWMIEEFIDKIPSIAYYVLSIEEIQEIVKGQPLDLLESIKINPLKYVKAEEYFANTYSKLVIQGMV